MPDDPISGIAGGPQTFTTLYGIDYAPQDGIIDQVFFERTDQGGQGDFGTQPG